MFGERCYGRPNCGHTGNWSCPCTCDEYDDGYDHDFKPVAVVVSGPAPSSDAFKLEHLMRYVQHDAGCIANDLDPLDRSPCTCGLRQIHNPWGRKETNDG